MSAFCQLERELAHISAMIVLLRDRMPLDTKSPVMDPAYWRARIRNAATQATLDGVLQQRVIDLIAQLDAIPGAPASRMRKQRRSRAKSRVVQKRDE
ncbi:hypothetical protein [Paraburkholderia phenazinium]|uniref:Uncharacterized protein n=1 Tax=Paraburkholderia phenazinium TaxID=60549 RepID=A0A1G8JS78_9BURK|nr:hypothetical protein [Paraburkholderia phenazinium]SDI34042.1 hypothetical protein SAMN05216466_12126 [Paraburkholderia phenazinium]